LLERLVEEDHGLCNRKKTRLLVVGMITDLFVPSSVTVLGFNAQFVADPSVAVCSNLKPELSREGQETVKLLPERLIESDGSDTNASAM